MSFQTDGSVDPTALSTMGQPTLTGRATFQPIPEGEDVPKDQFEKWFHLLRGILKIVLALHPDDNTFETMNREALLQVKLNRLADYTADDDNRKVVLDFITLLKGYYPHLDRGVLDEAKLMAMSAELNRHYDQARNAAFKWTRAERRTANVEAAKEAAREARVRARLEGSGFEDLSAW